MALSFARQRLGKHVAAATNTRNNTGIVGPVVFFAVRVLSRKEGNLFFPELLVNFKDAAGIHIPVGNSLP
jgi:hypothetical protein